MPITVKFYQPGIIWSLAYAYHDTIDSTAIDLGQSLVIPSDTTNSDSVKVQFPVPLIPMVQSWVSSSLFDRSDTNWGIWLRADTMATSIRSFSPGIGIDSLRPRLTVVLSKMLAGNPVGIAETLVVESGTDISTVSETGTASLAGLQTGAGDAVRGVIWFSYTPFHNRLINVHRAKLTIFRAPGSTNFGGIEALYPYLPYGDSTQWSGTEPTLASTVPRLFAVSDSSVTIEISNIVARYIALNMDMGAVLLTDAWEGITVNRTVFGSVSNGRPARLDITYSKVAESR